MPAEVRRRLVTVASRGQSRCPTHSASGKVVPSSRSGTAEPEPAKQQRVKDEQSNDGGDRLYVRYGEASRSLGVLVQDVW